LIRAGLTEDEKRNHVRSLNLLCRHLSTEQQKPYWIEMRKSGMTYQAIAYVSGVDESTIRKSIPQTEKSVSEITNTRGQKRPARYKPRQPKTVRRSVSGNSETQPHFVIGKDGKKYPATKPRQPVGVAGEV